MDAVIIGAASGGGGLVLLLVLCCVCLPVLVCCCVRYRKSSSAAIMNSSQFPKFRVIDAPNPSFIKIEKHPHDSCCSYVDPLDSSSPYHQCTDDGGIDGRSPAKLPSKVSSTEDKSVSEYSYALPNEIRVIPSFIDNGSRELLTESTFNNTTESSPIRQASYTPTSPPPQLDNYGSCADYSSPIAVSPASSPTPKSPGNSTSNTVSEDEPHSLYMTPATSEESLYQQIKSMKVPYISKDAIAVRDELGSGNFGCVLRCTYSQSSLSTSLDVAAKTLKEKYAIMDKIRFLQEAAIMGQFHHKNIVKLHGVVVEDKPLMIILELMPNGDLRNHLIHINPSNHDRLPETLLTFCRQISSGMEYLSSKSFIHRDLAARNILLSKHLVCKIGDFGLARDLMDEEYYIAHGGVIPVRWTAPEAINYRKYSTASDVWSYGCLMYEIWSLGHKPYGRKTNKEVLKMVEEGSRLPPPPGCPRILYHIMIECWHPSTSCRPSFTDISEFLDDSHEDLLSWSEEDKRSVPSEGIALGSSLAVSEGLFIDLQLTYTSV